MDCKRCGRKLKNNGFKDSGYGAYCYSVINGKIKVVSNCNVLKQEGDF